MGLLASEWVVSDRKSIILDRIFFAHLKLDSSDFFLDHLIYNIFELGLHFHFIVEDSTYMALPFHLPIDSQ